ncbi:MAG: YraN family protein [Patescibacteria group bacterium]
MKNFSSETQKKGEIGESIACTYLMRNGFEVLDRNYTRKWGEVDIIALKQGILHFIEVKSVTRENFDKNLNIRPEDQMHAWKQRKLARTIELYINERATGKWQFDVACVYMNMTQRKARVVLLEDIILQ